MIIDGVQAHWVDLVDHLRLPRGTVEVLKAQPNFTPQKACREVFNKWLNSEGDPEVLKTWETVITVIHRINPKLASEIRDVLIG